MTLCYFWLIVFPGFQIYSILYTIYIPKQEIPENYLANRKTKNNTQLQEEWIRRKYVVPVNIMESENNLIVENAIGGKNYYLPVVSASFCNVTDIPKSVPLVETDMYKAMEIALNYLNSTGHKIIAYGFPYDMDNQNSRYLAYKDYIRKVIGIDGWVK